MTAALARQCAVGFTSRVFPNPQLLTTFRELHEKLRKGSPTDEERAEYKFVLGRVSELLTSAQRLTVQPGQQARHYFRIATVWPITIDFSGKREKTSTIDLSFGGFSAILGSAVAPQSRIHFALKLPKVTEHVVGEARVVGGRATLGDFRGSFAFETVDARARDALEFALADHVLAYLKL